MNLEQTFIQEHLATVDNWEKYYAKRKQYAGNKNNKPIGGKKLDL